MRSGGKPLSVVLTAAGGGRRMRNYGPKSLLTLHGATRLLDHQVSSLRAAFGDPEIILVVGCGADEVVRAAPRGLKIVENEGWEESHVGRSLELGLRVVSHDRVLVAHGDLCFNPAAVGPLPGYGSSLLVSRKLMSRSDVGVTVVGGRVTRFDYTLPMKWGQAAYFEMEELGLLAGLLRDRDSRQLLLHELIEGVITGGGSFRALEPPGGLFVEVDTPQDLVRAAEVVCGFSSRRRRKSGTSRSRKAGSGRSVRPATKPSSGPKDPPSTGSRKRSRNSS